MNPAAPRSLFFFYLPDGDVFPVRCLDAPASVKNLHLHEGLVDGFAVLMTVWPIFAHFLLFRIHFDYL